MRLERMLFALALAGLAVAASAQSWAPKRSVEIVVGFAAGGSQDLTARTVERLLVANKLVNVPVAVVNKPGAGGSLAYVYVSQRPADGHTLMVAGTSLISGHILGTNAFNYTDFTAGVQLTCSAKSTTWEAVIWVDGDDGEKRWQVDPAVL